jgi:DNA-binding helix-hairpin-helix protein with protein kinase domain
VRTQNGRSVVLGNELGKGGEGIVYEVQGDVALAAKLYHKDKAAERQQKIEAIAAAQWHKTTSCVAFPIDALLTAQGHFLGFTMTRIARNKPIHDLYSPTSRKTSFPRANFPFLIHTALNIATAVANVHHTGCVIGDINHSGILIADNAWCSCKLIQALSLQLRGRKIRHSYLAYECFWSNRNLKRIAVDQYRNKPRRIRLGSCHIQSSFHG